MEEPVIVENFTNGVINLKEDTMVKAKDFWEYLCEELDYRFFAGVR